MDTGRGRHDDHFTVPKLYFQTRKTARFRLPGPPGQKSYFPQFSATEPTLSVEACSEASEGAHLSTMTFLYCFIVTLSRTFPATIAARPQLCLVLSQHKWMYAGTRSEEQTLVNSTGQHRAKVTPFQLAGELNSIATADDLMAARVADLLHALSEDVSPPAFNEFIGRYGNPSLVHGYFHDNGFLKVEMARSDCGRVRLRLHLWGCSGSPVIQTIHNHSFDFVSRVIHGHLLNREYVTTQAGEGEALYAYAYHRRFRSEPQYNLVPAGMAFVQVLNERILEPGDTYCLTGKAFHTLDPEACTRAATILLTREHTGHADALVLSRDPQAATVGRNYVRLAGEDLRSAIATWKSP